MIKNSNTFLFEICLEFKPEDRCKAGTICTEIDQCSDEGKKRLGKQTKIKKNTL